MVQPLIDGLNIQPELVAETLYALGRSKDPRAVVPLRLLMKGEDYKVSGDAAAALGAFDDPKYEPELIPLLADGEHSGWRQVKICQALKRFGTPAAIPELEKLAAPGRWYGALDVDGCATAAIAAIKKRAGGSTAK